MYLEAITLSQSETKKTIHNYCSYFEPFITAIHLSSLQEARCGADSPVRFLFAIIDKICCIPSNIYCIEQFFHPKKKDM